MAKTKNSRIRTADTPWCVMFNLLMVYVAYELCRIAFLLENWNMFGSTLTWESFKRMSEGGLVFDTAAICYTNMLYLLLTLLPLHYKEIPWLQAVTKWIFVITNSICVIINLADSVFFPFNFQRSTAAVFKEFGNETNLGTIAGIEVVRHWYLVLLAVVVIVAFIKLYLAPRPLQKDRSRSMFFVRHGVSVLIFVPLVISGMRGGATSSLRPITISNAHQYVSQPIETGIVLNTPFSIIRTLGSKQVPVPEYFPTEEALAAVYSPLHYPSDSAVVRRKNVVILIVESFAKEFVGALNTHLDDGKYKGYTEFTDSLLPNTLYFSGSFANAALSIDAMPATLASIPRMSSSFVLSPYSLDETNSLATALKSWGYQTAFFHGADNNSMGFQAFARSIGFEDYLGRTEYGQDERFDGDKDFDGTWAIWDEPFLQFFALKMSQMKEPFLASVFTASSHHPFALPEEYKDVYKEEGQHKLHKCIRYTDNALRKFFATARRQPWFKNTIFVITADHASSKTTHGEYKTALGHFKIPIIFYDPSGEMPTGEHDGIAQQTDIMPTILSWLGYDKPYVAFGVDLLNTAPQDTWAFNWDHLPQYVKGDYVMQMTGDEVTAVYNYRTDTLMMDNLKGRVPEQDAMEREMKAVMQSCLSRMKEDRMTVRP